MIIMFLLNEGFIFRGVFRAKNVHVMFMVTKAV
jgi:hypothetical protein